MAPRMHRHLDWFPPIEWLGRQPFWWASSEGNIQAAMAAPADPPGIAWIRLFACAPGAQSGYLFKALLEKCLLDLLDSPPPIFACLSLNEWFDLLLKNNQFKLYQHIVGLSRELEGPLPSDLPNKELFIRPMEPDDLDTVTEIDQLAFEPIWQNSLDQVNYAFQQSAYATVAELNDQIVGFQISTSSMFSIHLARLAVRPELQRKRTGYSLVYDLLNHCQREKAWQITVNTQDNNLSSLAVYQRAGFVRTGEEFPVYRLTF